MNFSLSITKSKSNIYNRSYDRAKLKCSVDYCHFAIPKKFLIELGMENINYWFNVAVLISMCIVLDIVAYIILYVRIKKRITF